MKKDLIFAPILALVTVLLFLLKLIGMPAHIAVSVLGLLTLAVYTVVTKKEWRLPVLEIIMRACYGIALISGIVVIKMQGILIFQMAHRVSAALFALLLVALFVHKLIASKKRS